MPKVIQLPAIGKEGRFGNWLVHYLVGKCFAESVGATVEIPLGWVGEKLLEINDPQIMSPARLISPRELDGGFDGTVALPPFFQLPHRIVDPCLTRDKVHRVFRWKPEWLRVATRARVAVHIRRGDFLHDHEFPIVDKDYILSVASSFGCRVTTVCEDTPSHTGLFPDELSFLEDFQILMQADDIFVYPRSTFSQMAALLGHGQIFMPYNYSSGRTNCDFRAVNPYKPVVFPTKNNSLP